jgi:O-methyltransferase
MLTQCKGADVFGTEASVEVLGLRAVLDRLRPLTMFPRECLVELAWQVRACLEENIPGSFVECGVWRGGTSFLMAYMLREAGASDRKVWLFDSFEGIQPPEVIDGPAAFKWTEDTTSPFYYDNFRVSVEEVWRCANELGLSAYTELVKGWFDNTIPANRKRIGPIAILRIDCNWHAGVRCCLDSLYDQVVDGGFVILDYYNWDGCAIAVHEFLGGRKLAHRIEAVSAHGGLGLCAVFRKGDTRWSECREEVQWRRLANLAIEELMTIIPPGDRFILVDQDEWGTGADLAGRSRVPFLERDGEYWGSPSDDATAIRELERLRQDGAVFIVFGWPASWWLDYYCDLHSHLRTKYRCVLENDLVTVFDLRRRD